MAHMAQEEFDAWIEGNKKHNHQEADVVHRVWVAMQEAGNPITTVFDSEDEEPVTSELELDRLVFNLDECFLLTADRSWVRIVMGNDWDCLVDHTTDLEDVLKPVYEYIEKKADEEE